MFMTGSLLLASMGCFFLWKRFLLNAKKKKSKTPSALLVEFLKFIFLILQGPEISMISIMCLCSFQLVIQGFKLTLNYVCPFIFGISFAFGFNYLLKCHILRVIFLFFFFSVNIIPPLRELNLILF